MGHLLQLEVLILNDNQITSLPNSLFDLRRLKKLNLDNNQLTNLPGSIKKLSALEVLGVENNQLSQLPLELHACTELITLRAHDNPLIFPPKNYVQGTTKDLCKFPKEVYNRISKLVQWPS